MGISIYLTFGLVFKIEHVMHSLEHRDGDVVTYIIKT